MSQLSPRVSYEEFADQASAVHSALAMVSKAVADFGVETELAELVKLRASQINGCAFCLRLHLNLARKLGISSAKLDLLVAWREAGVFDDREKAALAWTEALTQDPAQGASDENYAALLRAFSPREAMGLTVAIGLINTWNRIAVALRFAPQIPRAA